MLQKKQRAPSKGHALLEYLVQRLSQHKEGMPVKDKRALEKSASIHSSIKAKPRKKPKKKLSIVKSKAKRIKSTKPSKVIFHTKSEKAQTQKPHKSELPKGRIHETRTTDFRTNVRVTNSKKNEKPVSTKVSAKKKDRSSGLISKFREERKRKKRR